MDLPSLYQSLTHALNVFDPDTEYSSKLDFIGGTGIFRAPQVDLANAVTALSQLATQQRGHLTRIEIYADTLTTSGQVTMPSTCILVTMVSRLAFVDTAGPLVFTITQGHPSSVRMVTDDHARNLEVHFKSSSGVTTSTILSFGPGILGNLVLMDKSGTLTVKNNLPPLLQNFDYLTAAEQIMDNGELRKIGFNEADE